MTSGLFRTVHLDFNKICLFYFFFFNWRFESSLATIPLRNSPSHRNFGKTSSSPQMLRVRCVAGYKTSGSSCYISYAKMTIKVLAFYSAIKLVSCPRQARCSWRRCIAKSNLILLSTSKKVYYRIDLRLSEFCELHFGDNWSAHFSSRAIWTVLNDKMPAKSPWICSTF